MNHINSIIHGDCLKVLGTLPAGVADCIITDPPFAMAGGLSNGMSSQTDDQFFCHWLTDVCRLLIRSVKETGGMFVWCDWRTVGVLQRALSSASERYDSWCVSQVLIHDRKMIGMGSPFRNCFDMIAVCRGKKTCWNNRIPKDTAALFGEYSYYGKHDHHPAEKVVAVASRLVGWGTDRGGVVLDPFCGSATTLVAAKQLGRKFIGIELDESFVLTGNNRLAETTEVLL